MSVLPLVEPLVEPLVDPLVEPEPVPLVWVWTGTGTVSDLRSQEPDREPDRSKKVAPYMANRTAPHRQARCHHLSQAVQCNGFHSFEAKTTDRTVKHVYCLFHDMCICVSLKAFKTLAA